MLLYSRIVWVFCYSVRPPFCTRQAPCQATPVNALQLKSEARQV